MDPSQNTCFNSSTPYAKMDGYYPPYGAQRTGLRLYDLWLQGTFINFREEEIFIFGAWVYAIMGLTTPTLFAN
jgi:hypothetical protein